MTETTDATETTDSTERGLTDAAAAFDRLLACAKPARDATRELVLLDRIVAAAERSPRLAAVMAGAAMASNTHPPVIARIEVKPSATQRKVQRSSRDWWGGAGIMAASLLVGIIAGQSTFSEQTVRGFEQATGIVLASASQDLAATLAFAEHGEDD